MNELTSMCRIRGRWIDSPSDIGLLILVIALSIAVNYFLPKYFPQLSEQMTKIICYGCVLVLALLWFIFVGT